VGAAPAARLASALGRTGGELDQRLAEIAAATSGVRNSSSVTSQFNTQTKTMSLTSTAARTVGAT
jgi:hypothetical protein